MTDNIIKGAKEAVEIASGDKPAARIRINGHTYVPEDRALQAQGREWGMGYERGLKQGRLQGRAHGLEEAIEWLERNADIFGQSYLAEEMGKALKEQTND